ncbi:hypothetical protein [Streptomyces sp. CBMA29]|uniref:hypothetical protein n=1 Tax=Streptomyces sp. CBMA29 TaxID=1896314 RepID=UPI001661E371|nr:hypothetical protein [Streptomyces sp. CBMA29]MBD0734067.1 hypothetical protein [Streptomyces sp. CBMA29]
MASSVITNPAFDKRILRLSQVHGSQTTAFQRGFLQTATRRNPSTGSRGAKRYRVNFLYNPSDLSESRSVNINDNATALPTELKSDADTGQVLGITGASISFSLLFDRTYEVANPQIWNRPEAAMGCYSDITAIFGLVGISQATLRPSATQVPYAPGQGPNNSGVTTTLGPGPTTSSTTTANANPEQTYGVMKLNPVFAVFCPVRTLDPSGFNTGVSMMRYYGYINTLGIQYTHWTQRMIPVRCVVNVSMALLMTDRNLVEP